MNLTNLDNYAKTKYSQTGEEGILEYIFSQIGTTNKFAVEFGAGDGSSLSNTKYFKDAGWDVVMMDGRTPPSVGVNQEFLTVENINQVFAKYKVPQEFDLLSMDIDGNEYWIWQVLQYSPRVIIVEINGTIDPSVSKTVPYSPSFRHSGVDDYYGVSLAALRKLGIEKGYTLVHQRKALNAFFIRSDIIPGMEFNVTYTKCQYHPHDTQNRPWITI
jgi:hypothetical protein